MPTFSWGKVRPADPITSTIFVFGSNLAGRHGAGAALYAATHHGAQLGQGEGLQGNSWGIPTKDAELKTRQLPEIKESVAKFLKFARTNIHMTFQVTAIGCGLAGYCPKDIGPMFEWAPYNCSLPPEFETYRKSPEKW